MAGEEQRTISECPAPACPVLGMMAVTYSFLIVTQRHMPVVPACCSKALKTHSESYKMTVKPHSFHQRRLVQQVTWGLSQSQAETGPEWVEPAPRRLRSTECCLLSLASEGLQFLWGRRTMLVTKAMLWLSCLCCSPWGRREVSFSAPASTLRFMIRILSPYVQPGSLAGAQAVPSNSLQDLSLWRPYW